LRRELPAKEFVQKLSFPFVSRGESKYRAISNPNTVWMLIYGTVICALIIGAFGDRAYDDPFITYRYAVNILKGDGFVYNPGERVLSTTTPLFTLLLALLGSVWRDTPHLAVLLGAASLAAGGLLLWDLSRTWSTPLVGWTALVLYPSFPLLIATLGSETPIYLALCLAAFTAYFRQRYTFAGLAAGLATLARPDGILVAAILAVHFLVRRRDRIPWAGVLVFVVILLGWGVFAWAYFGSPLPATLAAKQQQGAMAISQRFAEGFFTILRGYGSWVYLLEGVLAVLGVGFAIFRRSSWLWLFAWTILYFISYSLLGVSRYFWYYAPLVPGFVAAAGLGLFALDTRSADHENDPSASLKWRKYLVVPLLILLFSGQLRSLWISRQQPDNRARIYQAVGHWLNSNTLPSQSVGALEVGIIGYYAERPMVDFAGLIQPQVAAQLTSGKDYEDAAIWAVETYRPDYLVLQEGLFPRLEGDYVRKNCRTAQEFSGADYGYPTNLYIFNCSG
jgi:arabinofuranosyltransferase